MFRSDRRDMRERGKQLIDVADIIVEPRRNDAGDREATLLGKLAIRTRVVGGFDGDISEKRQSQRQHEQQQTRTDAEPRGTLTQSQRKPGHVVVRSYRSNNQRWRNSSGPQSSRDARRLLRFRAGLQRSFFIMCGFDRRRKDDPRSDEARQTKGRKRLLMTKASHALRRRTST